MFQTLSTRIYLLLGANKLLFPSWSSSMLLIHSNVPLRFRKTLHFLAPFPYSSLTSDNDLFTPPTRSSFFTIFQTDLIVPLPPMLSNWDKFNGNALPPAFSALSISPLLILSDIWNRLVNFSLDSLTRPNRNPVTSGSDPSQFGLSLLWLSSPWIALSSLN